MMRALKRTGKQVAWVVKGKALSYLLWLVDDTRKGLAERKLH